VLLRLRFFLRRSSSLLLSFQRTHFAPSLLKRSRIPLSPSRACERNGRLLVSGATSFALFE
jgi:hypothetical protein